MSEGRDESAERSTALVRIATGLLPAEHLAPWMTKLNNPTCVLTATMMTIADMGDHLEWIFFEEEKNGKGKPAEPKGPQEPETPADKMPETPPKNGQEEFDMNTRRGPLAVLSKFNRSFVKNLWDVMPSAEGWRARQAMYLGSAQKTGMAYEPKPRSKIEWLTGRGKNRNQVSGVE